MFFSNKNDRLCYKINYFAPNRSYAGIGPTNHNVFRGNKKILFLKNITFLKHLLYNLFVTTQLLYEKKSEKHFFS